MIITRVALAWLALHALQAFSDVPNETEEQNRRSPTEWSIASAKSLLVAFGVYYICCSMERALSR